MARRSQRLEIPRKVKTLVNLKISIIGFGNMGSAIARAWLKNGLVRTCDLTIFDCSAEKKVEFSDFASEEAKARLAQSDIVLLAVKPQDLAEVSKNYQIPQNAILISILAGVSINKLELFFGADCKIVRAMPNLAAVVGRAQTGFVCNGRLEQLELQSVLNLLSSFGTATELSKEDDLDFWCALLGSGPGFVFYLMQAFQSVAQEKGFSMDNAKALIVDLFAASAALAKDSSESLQQLCQNVASKGGTTEAGLAKFEEAQLSLCLKRVLSAAEHRAKELNLL